MEQPEYRVVGSLLEYFLMKMYFVDFNFIIYLDFMLIKSYLNDKASNFTLYSRFSLLHTGNRSPSANDSLHI